MPESKAGSGMPNFTLDKVTLSPPAGYRAKMLVITGPRPDAKLYEQGFSPSVVLTRERVADSIDAEAYSRTQLGILAQSVEGFRRTANATARIAGMDCPLIDAQAQGPSGMLLANLIAYCVKDHIAYTLTATHLLGPHFKEARSEFVQIFESLAIGDAS